MFCANIDSVNINSKEVGEKCRVCTKKLPVPLGVQGCCALATGDAGANFEWSGRCGWN